MADLLTLEDFTPAVGDPFVIRFTDGEVTLTLAEAKPLGSETGKERDPFALLFHGPEQPRLPQATYALEHPRLGAQELFIVPVAPDQYEAIFT